MPRISGRGIRNSRRRIGCLGKKLVRETVNSLYSFATSQAALCSFPTTVLVIVASLDNADKQLLASSFPILERTLNLDVKTLGYFSLFSNLSYALSLPLWGFLVHKYGLFNIHVLLSIACTSWGCATLGIAVWGDSMLCQALLRAINGVMLGSILPLSQTLLVEMVSVSIRGRAFGWMGLCEKLAGTMAASSVVYWDENWQYSYRVLGIFSIFMGLVAFRALNPRFFFKGRAEIITKQNFGREDEVPLSLRQVTEKIIKLPAFLCMVAQGIFGLVASG